MSAETQIGIDAANASFWDELCGSGLARSIGATDASSDSLRRFDEAYLSLYPYLVGHLAPVVARQGRALEIGLGYGTVTAYLAQAGVDYHGLDIALNPVQMARDRLDRLGLSNARGQVNQGSALALPWGPGYFQAVVSIGCLHHTGDLRRSIAEIHRVLARGGVAVVMVYNRNSFRQLLRARPRAAVRRLLGHKGRPAERADYDANAAGELAPFTEFISQRQGRTLFSAFREVRIVKENMEALPRLGLPRDRLLGWPARLGGLDLYVTAVK